MNYVCLWAHELIIIISMRALVAKWLTMDAADYRSTMMHVRLECLCQLSIIDWLGTQCTSQFRCRNCANYFSICDRERCARTDGCQRLYHYYSLNIQYSMTQLAVSQ